MSFRIDDDKLLEKYKTISSKIEDLKNIELSVYDNRYTKTTRRTYLWWLSLDKFSSFKCARRWCRMWFFYNNFCWFFTYLWEQILSTNTCRYCPYKIVNTQTVDYLGDNLFESN